MGITSSSIAAGNGGPILTYGMVGGGPGAFIGDVHRKAIALDRLAVPAAGCFSRDRAASLVTGGALGLDPARCYADWEEMARAEAARPDGIDFVVIVTPNVLHAPVAAAFLSRGIHVACDKPLAISTGECANLRDLAREKGLAFCVTYTYTGYPAVKQARAVVASGELGEVRFVNAEYPQAFFARREDRNARGRLVWRFDPAQSGKVGSLGDVGTHIENLVACVTGLRLAKVCARLGTIVPGRALDDTDTVMTEYRGGATGLYWSCQAAAGEANDIRIRVYGSEGSLSWSHAEPDRLEIRPLDGPERVWKPGRDAADPAVAPFVRYPAGHPEGIIEAFANIYRPFIGDVAARKAAAAGSKPDYPGLDAGTDGIRFVEACVASSAAGSTWIEL